jgi:hypothetical protein
MIQRNITSFYDLFNSSSTFPSVIKGKSSPIDCKAALQQCSKIAKFYPKGELIRQ